MFIPISIDFWEEIEAESGVDIQRWKLWDQSMHTDCHEGVYVCVSYWLWQPGQAVITMLILFTLTC